MDFDVEPEFQEVLDWADAFVREEVEPLDAVLNHAWDLSDPLRMELIPPLQQRVRERGLWATHLGPELGGPGYGQVKLALLNEILGRTHSGPIVFGCQAPDSGNAEILAHYGTPELKQRYLEPLLRNDIVSAYSMTEPQGGSDPTQFIVRAELDGDEWVINGEKWFSSHANFASFLILLAVTDPDAPRYSRMSMFVVPAETPGVNILRNVPVYGHNDGGTHSYIRYENVKIPADHLLGERGSGFVVAQTRLGGGRIHHAMRTIGLVKRALDMMCERALSRTTQGELLGRKQLVQAMIADSWIQIEQFRLLVLQTAWKIDKYNDYQRVRGDISAVKAAMPKVLHDVAVAGGAGPRLPRRVRRDAPRRDGARVVPHGPRRRRDGGAPDHARPPDPQAVQGHRGPLPDHAPAPAARRRRGEVRRRAGPPRRPFEAPLKSMSRRTPRRQDGARHRGGARARRGDRPHLRGPRRARGAHRRAGRRAGRHDRRAGGGGDGPPTRRRRPASWDALAGELLATTGRPDALVNNAGIVRAACRCWRPSTRTCGGRSAVNVGGTFLGMQTFLRLHLATRHVASRARSSTCRRSAA